MLDEMTRMLLEIQKSTAETATNVHFLRLSFEEHKEAITKTLNEHIIEDKRILNDNIVPLLRDKEQAAGADKQTERTMSHANIAFAILIPLASFFASVFGGKVGH